MSPVFLCRRGGTVIEKHITLSRRTSGLDDPIALEGEQFAIMCRALRQSFEAMRNYGKERGAYEIIERMNAVYGAEKVSSVLGDGIKRLADSERENYGRTNRSIHFMRAMKKGERIKADDVAVLRTEKILTPGISPEFLENVIGARLTKDVTSGSGVSLSDLID